MNKEQNYWCICLSCQGRGKKSKRIRKKAKLKYQRECQQFEKNNGVGIAPVRPVGHLDTCPSCNGSGLTASDNPVIADKDRYPTLAIIGGGIGGVALGVACLHRGIPFTLYERDDSFEARSQGYGLTLQQASRAIEGLGIESLIDGVVSTRHVVHTTEGKIIGEWGIRKWGATGADSSPKRTNVHIARQSLRLALLKQLDEANAVVWGHQLVDYKVLISSDDGIMAETETGNKHELKHKTDHKKIETGLELTFETLGENKTAHTELLIGADGIRSTVRQLLIGDNAYPLKYLDCIVILGICPLASLMNIDSELLDSATVFQTANGNERIYMMPYKADSVMWQLSFPMSEIEAAALSQQGAEALKKEAIKRCQWHNPIPDILLATKAQYISGYPVYDRDLIDGELLKQSENITLIGDAAHPMSPFKGQGANQALLDALSLARTITKECRPLSGWRELGIRESVLNNFEAEMLARSAVKVKDSAEAAKFLHTDIVLHEGDEPRGRCLQRDQ